MNGGWAARLDPAAAHALGRLRRHDGIEILETPDAIWLRGDVLDEALELDLRKLPGALRSTVAADGALIPVGSRVPTHRLPPGTWVPLRDRVTVDVGTIALPAAVERRAAVRLVRVSAEAPASVVVASVDDWKSFVERAPVIRLAPLTFAASRDGRACIRGAPPPPIPGRRLVERDGVAVECGWAWDPPLDPAAMRALLNLAPSDFALFASDASVEIIPARSFVPAARPAVRHGL